MELDGSAVVSSDTPTDSDEAIVEETGGATVEPLEDPSVGDKDDEPMLEIDGEESAAA